MLYGPPARQHTLGHRTPATIVGINIDGIENEKLYEGDKHRPVFRQCGTSGSGHENYCVALVIAVMQSLLATAHTQCSTILTCGMHTIFT